MSAKKWVSLLVFMFIVTLSFFIFEKKVEAVTCTPTSCSTACGQLARCTNSCGVIKCCPATAPCPTSAPTVIPTTRPPTTAPTQGGGGGGSGGGTTNSCQACSTAACGECSDYAQGWRCRCTGLQPNGYYTSCTGYLDSSCGTAQPTPTGVPPGMCNRCTTGACGQCSDYAPGWRCKCYDQVGNYYKNCLGELDTTCGVAQPTPTPPCSKRYVCNLSKGQCKETEFFYTSANIQCNGTATCEENLAATQNNGTTGTCYDDMTICQKSCCPKKINGDADCDNNVTLKDYFYYVSKKVGVTLPTSVNVDFNASGAVDDIDRNIVVKTLKP